MGSYAIAYTDNNGNGFSDTEPWIEAGFEKDIDACRTRANEMRKDGLKNVTIFQFGNILEDTYTWKYVKEHEI